MQLLSVSRLYIFQMFERLTHQTKSSFSFIKLTMNKPELKQTYLDQVVPALLKSQGYKNIHQVPKIEKVVLNSSFGVELDKNGIEELRKDIMSLAGQAPVVVRAKMSVSNFKLREGMLLASR